MKKLLTILFTLLMVVTLAGCNKVTAKNNFQDYMDADLDTELELVVTIQDIEPWWDGKITLYCRDNDGGYLLYETPCATEEEAEALVPGTMLKVTGVKSEWAGELELVDTKYEIVKGKGKIYDAVDFTSLIGNDAELAKHITEKGLFKNLTVVSYDKAEGKDGYLLVKDANGTEITFVVRRYLTPDGSEVANAVAELKAGDVVDLEAYVYWYNAPESRITKVVKH